MNSATPIAKRAYPDSCHVPDFAPIKFSRRRILHASVINAMKPTVGFSKVRSLLGRFSAYVSSKAHTGSWKRNRAFVSESEIGVDCVIGAGARVRKSHLGNHVCMAENSRSTESMIDSFVSINEFSQLFRCRVGSFGYVAQRSHLAVSTTGRFCSIGPNVICGGGEHPTGWPSTSPVFYSRFRQCGITFADRQHFPELEPVVIGNDCWIGANSVIANGVIIGDGAIVGAGAVVTKDIAPFSIVGGVPAKTIRMRFNDQIVSRMIRTCWWDIPIETLSQNSHMFRSSNFDSFLDWAESIQTK